MKFHVWCCLLLIAGAATAQSVPEEKPIASKIERVTVFLQGAQILRTTETTLTAGKSVLVVKGLSPYADPATIKVSAKGQFTLLSVNHRRNFSEQREKTERVKALEQDISRIQDSTRLQQVYVQALDEEMSFLQANKSISGKDKAYSLSELKEISEFYATRILQLQREKLRINGQLQQLEKRLQQQQSQVREFQQAQAQVSGEIVLTVQAERAGQAAFELSYLVGNAGWFPSYDLKVRSVSEPIATSYKAGVYQNTGEDWNNVRLRFSNGNPKESGTMPQLVPYFLSPFAPRPQSGAVYPAGNYNPLVKTVSGRILTEQGEPLIGASVLVKGTNIGTVTDMDGGFTISIPEGARLLSVNFLGYSSVEAFISQSRMDFRLTEDYASLNEVVVTGMAAGVSRAKMEPARSAPPPPPPPPMVTLETATTVEFELQIPFTVPSDGEKYTVTLAELELKASYEYQAVPKLEKAAYLTAYVTDWEQYNLLEGEANLFFEDTYLGRSVLDTRFASDTLKLSLGRDRGVSVDRQSVQEFRRRGFVGGKKTDSRTYRIVVRNGKAQPIKIIVKDQIPVSQAKEIEVLNVQVSGGEVYPPTGQVSWIIQLAPGEQKEILLQYEVRYPRDMILKIE